MDARPLLPLALLASLTLPICARQLPLTFEANRGQAPRDVRFLAHARGYVLALKDSEAVISAGGRDLRLQFAATFANPMVEGRDLLPAAANYYLGGVRAKWIESVPLFGKVVYRAIAPGVRSGERRGGGR